MGLSFTENFERVGFSPVEEARFFYKALEIKDIFNIKNVKNLPKVLKSTRFYLKRV